MATIKVNFYLTLNHLRIYVKYFVINKLYNLNNLFQSTKSELKHAIYTRQRLATEKK